MFNLRSISSARDLLRLIGFAVLPGIMIITSITEAFAEERPLNFIIMLADDLGYGDLACYGHPTIRTPNLDRLASKGIRFTNCYSAAPICSPSRAGLMTGRTPTRAGIYTWIDAGSPMHLRREEVTLAKLLQQRGYQTCHAGKWHVNGIFNRPEQPQPNDHGFDYWFATHNNAAPTHENPVNFIRNGKKVRPQPGYSCELVVDEAVDWLKKRDASATPFYLSVCFHETHEKVASPPDLVASYPSATQKGEAIYYASVTNMDRAIGKLLQTVDELKLTDDTLIIFTSDHGPEILNLYPEAWRSYGSAGPFRGKKRDVYEGGIRVPGIMSWAGHLPAGQVNDTPVCSLDFLPTLCELGHASLPENRTFDGTSLVPLFEGRPLTRVKPLFWHFYGGSDNKQVALRDGDWKLVAGSNQDSSVSPHGTLQQGMVPLLKRSILIEFQLFHLPTDPGEQHNLAAAEPERLQRMAQQAEKMYQEVLAEGPTWFND